MSVRACFGRAKAVVRLAVARLREASARGFSKFSVLFSVLCIRAGRRCGRTWTETSDRDPSMDSRMRRTPPGVTQLDMMGGCLNAARVWVRVAPAEVGTRGSNTSTTRA